MRPEILVLDSSTLPVAPDVTLETEILGSLADVTLVRYAAEEELMRRDNLRVNGCIVWHPVTVTRGMIDALPHARLYIRCGTGFDNIDYRHAASKGIPVCNVPDYGTEEVADHALMMALALIRRLRPLLRDTGDGHWRWETAKPLGRIRGRVFGIVGLGRIGTAAALRAKAFGFDVLFYDPFLTRGVEKALGIRRVDTLADLLRQADVLSLHCPAGERHLIAQEQLALMKPSAYLVNTARGALVDSRALLAALQAGQLAGAGLDVLEQEPAMAATFAAREDCLVTPHSAFYSEEGFVEMRVKAAEVVRAVLEGGKAYNIVNGV